MGLVGIVYVSEAMASCFGVIGGVAGEKSVGWMGKWSRRLVEIADSVEMGDGGVGGWCVVRSGVELVASDRKGLAAELKRG